jgi:hypothetical protein
LIIRNEQFKTFQEVANKNFVDRVAKFLREKHGNLSIKLPSGDLLVSKISDEDLKALIQKGIDKAQEYGMTWETSLTSFVVIMFMIAPNFHEHPTVISLLQDESIEANARIDRLVETFGSEDWQTVKEGYDSQSWGLKT